MSAPDSLAAIAEKVRDGGRVRMDWQRLINAYFPGAANPHARVKEWAAQQGIRVMFEDATYEVFVEAGRQGTRRETREVQFVPNHSRSR